VLFVPYVVPLVLSASNTLAGDVKICRTGVTGK
jgi:hypothetical protein